MARGARSCFGEQRSDSRVGAERGIARLRHVRREERDVAGRLRDEERDLGRADERVPDGGIAPVGLDLFDALECGESVFVGDGVRLREREGTYSQRVRLRDRSAGLEPFRTGQARRLGDESGGDRDDERGARPSRGYPLLRREEVEQVAAGKLGEAAGIHADRYLKRYTMRPLVRS